MMRKACIAIIAALLAAVTFSPTIIAQEEESVVVQAILFYRPTCPHCHDVMEKYLPPLKEKYGNQLQLVGIDTSHQVGSQLYEDMIKTLEVPQDRLGVPTLVIGNEVLVGGQEIPDRFPGLIEEGLANGGIAWPAIPGLTDAVPNLPPPAGSGSQQTTSTSVSSTPNSEVVITEAISTDSEVPPNDPVGFAIGWMVMIGMLLTLVYAVVRIWRFRLMTHSDGGMARRFRAYSIPTLAIVGLAIASYLSYVEVSRVAAVCGPVGECNIVQSSEYAQIFGIPIAILGALFYLAILSLWLLIRITEAVWTARIPLLLLILTIVGTLFSIYLTALELFLIKAVCAWCLGSAIVTTLLLSIVVTKLTKQDDNVVQIQPIASKTG